MQHLEPWVVLRVIAGLITPTRGKATVFDGSPQQHRHRILSRGRSK